MSVILEQSLPREGFTFPTYTTTPDSWNPSEWRHQVPLATYDPLLQDVNVQLMPQNLNDVYYPFHIEQPSWYETGTQSNLESYPDIDSMLLMLAENAPSTSQGSPASSRSSIAPSPGYPVQAATLPSDTFDFYPPILDPKTPVFAEDAPSTSRASPTASCYPVSASPDHTLQAATLSSGTFDFYPPSLDPMLPVFAKTAPSTSQAFPESSCCSVSASPVYPVQATTSLCDSQAFSHPILLDNGLESFHVPLCTAAGYAPQMASQYSRPQFELHVQQPQVYPPFSPVPSTGGRSNSDTSESSSDGSTKAVRRKRVRSARQCSAHPYRRPSRSPKSQFSDDSSDTSSRTSTGPPPPLPCRPYAHLPDEFWEAVSSAARSYPRAPASSTGSPMLDSEQNYSIYRDAVLASYPGIKSFAPRNELCEDHVHLSLDVQDDPPKCTMPGCSFEIPDRKKAKTDVQRHIMTHMNFAFVCCGKRIIEQDDSGNYIMRFEGGCKKTFSRKDALQRHVRKSTCTEPDFQLPIRLPKYAN